MELLAALFQASQSNDAGMRECAFRIFSTTPGIIEREHEGVVQEVFGKGFKDSSVDVGCPMDDFGMSLLIYSRSDCPPSRRSQHFSIQSPKRLSRNTSP